MAAGRTDFVMKCYALIGSSYRKGEIRRPWETQCGASEIAFLDWKNCENKSRTKVGQK